MPSPSSLEPPLSFTMESTLSSPCSRSDLLFSRQGADLAHLDSLPPHDLMLWTDSSVPFLFGKGGSGVLANWSLCGTNATLSFPAGPVYSSFSAEACVILHALCWSRQHQQVCHFSSYLTLVLSSPPCLLHLSCYLKLCGRSGRNCFLFPSVLSGYNGSPDTRFCRKATRLMSWPDGERYLHTLQSLVVSLLLSVIATSFFSDWRRTASSKYFDPQVRLISTEELVLPRHARCIFSRLRCNGHNLLLSSYLFRIGRILPAAPAYTHPRTPFISFCTVQLRTLRRSFLGDSLSLRPRVQALGSFRASGAPWSSDMAPSLERGRVTATILRLGFSNWDDGKYKV